MRLTTFACIAALLMPAIAQAEQRDNIAFKFSLSGITAGELKINGAQSGNSYAANGVLATTGLLGALSGMRYDASVQGTYRNGKYTPTQFDETQNRRKRVVKSQMVFRNGVPVSVTRDPPRAPLAADVDPAKQGGTIDPLTALYAVLRDVPRGEACKLSEFMFDGSKRTQVVLGSPQAKGSDIVCSGEYRRIAGFDADEMAKQPVFRFTLTYTPLSNDQMRVTDIVTDTVLGKGRLTRQ